MRTRLVVVLGVLLTQSGDALRSCTKDGQVRVPCHDELLLGKTDRFLLTLFGHSCYTMNIVSPQPLEVLFYDSRDLKSGRSGRRLQDSTGEGTNETMNSLAALGDNQDCRNVLSCVQLQEGLSKATVYNLVISRWSNDSEDELDHEDGPIRVSVELEHCDPASPWHYVGLVFVGSIGFTSTMLLLCIVGEFVLGLRTITKLQNAAQRDRFVELAQLDPTKRKGSEKNGDKDCEEPEESEEPTAPLMTTVIATASEPTAEPENSSPA